MKQQESRQGFRWEIRNCVDCGKRFVAKHKWAVRCLDCRSVHRRELAKERARKQAEVKRAEEPKVVEDNINICKKIKSCRYGIRAGGIDICDYLEQEGERRPCPAGRCTEFKRKTRRGGESDGMHI